MASVQLHGATGKARITVDRLRKEKKERWGWLLLNLATFTLAVLLMSPEDLAW
jgi:hypothetical protein